MPHEISASECAACASQEEQTNENMKDAYILSRSSCKFIVLI